MTSQHRVALAAILTITAAIAASGCPELGVAGSASGGGGAGTTPGTAGGGSSGSSTPSSGGSNTNSGGSGGRPAECTGSCTAPAIGTRFAFLADIAGATDHVDVLASAAGPAGEIYVAGAYYDNPEFANCPHDNAHDDADTDGGFFIARYTQQSCTWITTAHQAALDPTAPLLLKVADSRVAIAATFNGDCQLWENGTTNGPGLPSAAAPTFGILELDASTGKFLSRAIAGGEAGTKVAATGLEALLTSDHVFHMTAVGNIRNGRLTAGNTSVDADASTAFALDVAVKQDMTPPSVATRLALLKAARDTTPPEAHGLVREASGDFLVLASTTSASKKTAFVRHLADIVAPDASIDSLAFSGAASDTLTPVALTMVGNDVVEIGDFTGPLTKLGLSSAASSGYVLRANPTSGNIAWARSVPTMTGGAHRLPTHLASVATSPAGTIVIAGNADDAEAKVDACTIESNMGGTKPFVLGLGADGCAVFILGGVQKADAGAEQPAATTTSVTSDGLVFLGGTFTGKIDFGADSIQGVTMRSSFLIFSQP